LFVFNINRGLSVIVELKKQQTYIYNVKDK